MSKRTSVAPPGYPTHPTKLVVEGVPPGPRADQLIDLYRAPLRRFHSAQQQNLSFNMEAGVAVHRASTTFGDGSSAVYSNVYGQETLQLKVAPQVLAQYPETPPPQECWSWALIELTIPDMVGFSSRFAARIRAPLTTRLPAYDPSDLDPSSTHDTGVMFGGYSIDADEDNELQVDTTDKVLSLRVDLQPFHRQKMQIELYGHVEPRTVVGGLGGDGATCTGSTIYGRYGLESLDEPLSLAAAAAVGPPALWTFPESDATEKLVATFPETADLPAAADEFIGVGYSILFFWDAPGVSGWGGFSDAQIIGIDRDKADEFAGLYEAQVYDVTYWDPDHLFKRIESWDGMTVNYSFDSEGEIASNVLLDGTSGTTVAVTYRNQVDYYVPTWRYDQPRTGEMMAVMVRPDNPWRRTSRYFGTSDNGEIESFVWETTTFPRRPPMRAVADVTIPVEEAQDDAETGEDGIFERGADGAVVEDPDVDPSRFQGMPLIGTIIIDVCGFKIEFEQAEYTPPPDDEDEEGGGE